MGEAAPAPASTRRPLRGRFVAGAFAVLVLAVVGANLPAMILGIDLKSIALFVLLERLYTVMLHSNLNLDWGWFSKIVASPNLHRLHHQPTTRGKNYAGILSLLDVLANTYEPPAPKPGSDVAGDREHKLTG